MVNTISDPLPIPIVSLRSSLENKTGSWKSVYPIQQELIAPCRQTCPIGNDIPRIIQAIAENRFSDALVKLREETPFPGVASRSCSRFCMVPCNQKNLEGKRISIADLEQAASDYGTPKLPNIYPPNGHQVAVIGAGAVGLTSSYFLSWLGYQVTLFDAKDRPGGKLWTDERYRRVPEKVLQSEINLVLDLVSFQPNMHFGTDLLLHDLTDYTAVFLAIDGYQDDEFKVIERGNIALLRYTMIKNTLVAYAVPDSGIKRWMITYAIRAGKQTAIIVDQILTKGNRDISDCYTGPGGSISFMWYLKGRPSYVKDKVAVIDYINQDTASSRFLNLYSTLPDQVLDEGSDGISLREAIEEAQRCLSCGVCNLCGVCVMSCPDLAVMEINGKIEFNYDYCKGCAICVEECPRGALRVEIAG